MTFTFLLRTALEKDADMIKRLVQGEQLNPMGLHWQNFTMAETEDGTVIGCVQLKPHKNCQELASLVVVKSWRKQGVAEALIEDVKMQSGKPLYLMCADKLAPFYAKYGFVQLTERRGMPAYFRRIHLIATLIRKTNLFKEQLAIMSWS